LLGLRLVVQHLDGLLPARGPRSVGGSGCPRIARPLHLLRQSTRTVETSLATPSAIWHLDCEYSSLRCRAVADPPTVRFSTTGAKDMVSTGPRSARATCSRCLMGYPPWSRTAVNMLAVRSASASDTLAQHPCSSTAVRATAGCSARASEPSNLAPRLRPARRTVAG
jgi:hypothetical protein